MADLATKALRDAQEGERKAGIQVRQVTARLQMHRQASVVLDLYRNSAREIAPNQVEGRQWAGRTLRTFLDSAHKCFIGPLPKHILLPRLVDTLTAFFVISANVDRAVAILERDEDSALTEALDDSIEPAPPTASGFNFTASSAHADMVMSI